LPQLRGTHTRGRGDEAIETQTLETAEESRGDAQPLRLLLRLHGERVTDRSYAVKALEALPRMGKRFYREHGLPLRGKEPRRYRYCPQRTLAHLRGEVMREIADIDAEAQTRIAGLLGALDEAEGRLRSRVEAGEAPDE
jgi:hypothetical protein